MRRMLGWALLLAATGAQAQTPTMAERMAAFPRDRSVEAVEAYVPAQTVRGGAVRTLARAGPGNAGISDAALVEAQALAEKGGAHALIIARNGKVVLERYWNGFGAGSRFSTASMHKTVLALAYGRAVQQRRIALADPLARLLPEWKADARGGVQIGQLLEMTSGLAFPPSPPGPGAPSARLFFADDIRAVALAVPQDAPPGSRFAYSNIDSQLAGEALASAVGGNYARWLSRELWAPLGAADASLFMDRVGGSPHYFCCLQARARDWLLVGELLREGGKLGKRQLVPADWIATMTAPSTLNPNFGKQIWRGSPHAPLRRYSASISMTIPAAEPFLADDVLFIDGAGAQRVYAIPSKGLTIVRIGRPDSGWDDSRLPNIILRGLAG